MICFLTIGNDTLDDAVRCHSITYAIGEFQAVAEEFDRFGSTPPDGAIYIARSRETLTDYPDYVLSLGPRGGVQKSNT